MRPTLLSRCALSAAAVLLATAGATSAAQAAPVLSDQDQTFVTLAGHGNAFEIAAGGLAASRAGHEDVRSFGAAMVTEHTAAADALQTVAEEVGLEVPDAPDPQQGRILGLLATQHEAAFDCLYVSTEHFDHVATIGVFERQAEHGDNPELRAFARDTLPTLRHHGEMLAELLDTVECPTAR